MIRFSLAAQTRMLEDAVAGFPDESCGFLFGHEGPDGNRYVKEIWEVVNAKEGDKRRRFLISAKDYLRAEAFAMAQSVDLLGVYHSHPNHPPIPSEEDRVAAQPYFSYIIVSVRDGRIDHTRSWRLTDAAVFEEETLAPFSLQSSIQ